VLCFFSLLVGDSLFVFFFLCYALIDFQSDTLHAAPHILRKSCYCLIGNFFQWVSVTTGGREEDERPRRDSADVTRRSSEETALH